ncbi:response regulator transcription factor [Ideonella sp. YS5]|uniref:response regulator transcription factor n=1 Tax=Ideonella sp. YS5 TaxID=3453714 RepID=UPI003EEEA40D
MLERLNEFDASRPLKVLAADDNFASRQWLARLLRQLAPVELREVRDGREALEAFHLARPDVVFLDIDMPELDGMQVLKEIRQADPQAFVVMVSALSSAAKVQQALELGVSGFIVKPYSAQRVVDILHRLASRQRDASSAPAD